MAVRSQWKGTLSAGAMESKTMEEEQAVLEQDPERELKAMSAVLDVPVEVKDVVGKWALITYDIPKADEGDKLRYEFYKQARRLGAIQHTESVYLMPWTHDANVTILQMAMGKAKVYVWGAETDPETTKSLTVHYDLTIMGWVEELEERLAKIAGHLRDGHARLAGRMIQHTLDLLADLDGAAKRRGSAALIAQLAQARRELAEVIAQAV